MKKYILTGGISLLVCLYSFCQPGLQFSSEEGTTEIGPSELFNNAILSANGYVNGFHSDGRIRYSGAVKKSKLHGNWKSWYEDDILHDEGKLVKGVPDGQWKVWYPNGNIRFIRTYSSDKLLRVKQQLLRPHPKMPNFSITTLYQQDRKKAASLLKSNYSFQKYADNDSYVPVFKDCIHHGLFMNFYDNGSIKDSGYYKNGLREGLWIEGSGVDENYWTGTYKNGIKSGPWKRFNQQKKMTELIEYKNGKVDWTKKY